MKTKAKHALQIRVTGDMAKTIAEWSKLTGQSCNRIVGYCLNAAFESTVDGQRHLDVQTWLNANAEVEKQRKLAATRIAEAKAKVPR